MSHEIETMFSVREKPWHWAETKEVTKLIQEAPTSAEALKYAGLDWNVEPKPIYTEVDGIFGKTMTPIPGFVANTRDSDGAVLGVVTDAYKIVQNVDGGYVYESEARICEKCAMEHRQLAEWLEELKERRENENA